MEAESTKEEEIEKMVKELEQSRAKFLKETGRAATGPEESMDPLLKSLKGDDEHIRKLATIAMEAVGAPSPEASADDLNTQGAYLQKLAEVALGGAAPTGREQGNQKIDSKHLGSLIKGLGGDSPEDRREIILKLGELGEAGVGPLITELENKSMFVRTGATFALSMIGPDSVTPLIKALQNKDWDVRRRAAQALSWIGEVKAVPALILALEDENTHVRLGAADALSIIGGSDVKSVLEKYNDDKLF